MSKKQVIKLKKIDLEKVLIRGSARSAWKIKKALNLKEQVHRNPKFKKLKHKKNFTDEDLN